MSFSQTPSETPPQVPSQTPLSQEASTQDSVKKTYNHRGKTDPAWGHCKQLVEQNGKMVLLCIYCDKVITGGGINRFKNHLAGEKGQVEECKKVSPDIRAQMKQLLVDNKNKKRKVQENVKEGDECDEGFVGVGVSEMQETNKATSQASQRGKNVMDSYFMPRTTPGAQPTLKSVLQSKQVTKKCDMTIAKWLIDASLPFNSLNSAYYQPMIDAIASMGAGYKGPNYHRVRGYLLNKLVDDVKKMIEGYREIWKQTGCTIMADGWTDRCRRTLINFLVYCPKGTVFIKSVDASNASKTSDMLYKLFREVVLFVGPENVVHMVTDNAANYVAAGRLLEGEFPKLCWSPCTAHCLNLMLQDIGKLDVLM